MLTMCHILWYFTWIISSHHNNSTKDFHYMHFLVEETDTDILSDLTILSVKEKDTENTLKEGQDV